MPETMMKMPALAVVGPDHRIIRSTETFRRRYEGAKDLCERSPELDRVLTGRADAARVELGELKVEIEAVTDAAGRRQAMLTLPPDELAATLEPVAALRDAAEGSPALVWVKDLDGHYLYANPRYVNDLGTSEERLYSNTDADLPETETVDGPRLRYAEDGLEEPLQLEYTVPAIDHRPALAVFRFALRDDAGQPIATCGVAAPTGEAQVARDEAVRLMQLERWNRLDPVEVRAELLEQWHVQTAPPRLEEPEDDAAAPEASVEESLETVPAPNPTPPVQPEPASPEPDEPPARGLANEDRRVPEAAPPEPSPDAPSLAETVELLQADLQLARKWADRADQLQGELHEVEARAREAETEAQQARVTAARATAEAERWRSELEQAKLELERAQTEAQSARADLEAAQSDAQSTRADLKAAQAEAHAARSETEVARGELGAARAQAEALRAPSAVALRLSEELGRALAAEKERGEEMERMLARLRSRLTDFETAFEQGDAVPAPGR